MKLRVFLSIKEIYVVTACFSLFVAAFCLFGVKNVGIVSSYNKNKNCKERM